MAASGAPFMYHMQVQSRQQRVNEALAISLCESGGLHSHENHVRAYQRVRVCGRQGACHMYERISSGELGRFMHLLVDNLLPFSGCGRTVERGQGFETWTGRRSPRWHGKGARMAISTEV